MADYVDDNIIFGAKIQEVFIDLGVFHNDAGARRYLKAPIRLVQMNGSLFVMPEPIGGNEEYKQLYSADVFDEDQYMGRQDFGFHTLDKLVVEEQQFGNWESDPDGILGMHRFGWL